MNSDFDFFQQAVLSIIGNLDPEQSFTKTFCFLREYFPLEAIAIDRYSEERGGICMSIVVTEKGVFNVNQFVPLNEEENLFMQERECARSIITVADGVAVSISNTYSLALQQFCPVKSRGFMVAHLSSGNTLLGSIVFIGQEVNCFGPRHERLLGMLLGPFSLAIHNRLKLKTFFEGKKQSDVERERLKRELRRISNPPLVGAKSGLKTVMENLRLLESREPPVLILGETGTGKELVANAVQRNSKRRGAPFIRVNCGAIPESLLDSELFGYEKGSFTGAGSTRIGRFEQADGGTLFLDEVGELSLSAQVRLLRVLQDGLVERIGSTRPTPVDVRIIAATNRDLSLMRRQGLFREDLYHRLNVFPIHIPALRERPEDIPLLIRYFAERIALRMELPPPVILPESLERAKKYAWPGNVRELENIVERALILTPEGPLDIGRYLPSGLMEAFGTPLPEKMRPQGLVHGTPWRQEGLREQAVPARYALAPVSSVSDVPRNHAERGGGAVIPGAGLFALDEQFIRMLVDERVTAALKTFNLTPPSVKTAAPSSLDEVMAAHITEALAACNGKIYGPGGAAERLGVNHSTLRNRMKKLGIHRGRNMS